MKRIIFIICLLGLIFYTNLLTGQSNKHFYINIFGYLQEVDERLVSLTNRDIIRYKQKNEEMNPDLTRQIGIGLGIELDLSKNFSINSEINYSYERNNYIRRFLYHQLEPPNSQHLSIPRSMDIYSFHLIGNSTGISYELPFADRIIIGTDLNTLFRFKSVYHEAVYSDGTSVWDKKDFFSFEVNPFIGYKYKFLELDICYRLFHYKKLDRAVFNKYNTGYGAIENDYETYNPTKFGISIKYWFSLFRKKSNNAE